MASSVTPPVVLFDLDDTLIPWQTVIHWQWAWRPNGPMVPERHAIAAIKRCVRNWDRRRWQGVVGALPPVEAADYRQFLRATLTEVAGHSLPPEELEAVLDRFLRAGGEIERFDDAPPSISRLLSEGRKVGVITDLPSDTARSLLKRSGLDERLLVLSAEGVGVPRLPAIAAFRLAAERLGVRPSQVLYVGDLYWSDSRAAHRAGLTSVLLDRRDIWPRVVGTRIASLSDLPNVLSGPSTPPPGSSATPPPTPVG